MSLTLFCSCRAAAAAASVCPVGDGASAQSGFGGCAQRSRDGERLLHVAVEVGKGFRQVAFHGLRQSVGEGERERQHLRLAHRAEQAQGGRHLVAASGERRGGADRLAMERFTAQVVSPRHAGECARNGCDALRVALGHGQFQAEVARPLRHVQVHTQRVVRHHGHGFRAGIERFGQRIYQLGQRMGQSSRST